MLGVAALVHGLSVRGWESDVSVVVPSKPRRPGTRVPSVRGGRTDVLLRRRSLRMLDDDITTVSGLPVTTVLRTEFDKVVYEKYVSKAEKKGMKFFNVITTASIIERESQKKENSLLRRTLEGRAVGEALYRKGLPPRGPDDVMSRMGAVTMMVM